LVVDLESLRSLFVFKAGLGREFEVAASLPIYVMHGGFLDGFISAFHNAFGFPNGVRDREADNVFRYLYLVDGRRVLERDQGFVGLGDFTLQLKKAVTWKSLGKTELAARAALKLPTGSRDRVTGSGGTDFGFGAEISRVGQRFGGYFNLSYHILDDIENLPTRDFLSFMAAIDWRFKKTLSGILQYDQFQRFVESDIPVLNKSGRQIILGLRWRKSDRLNFEWRLAEDLSTAAPDFSFGFQVAVRWRRDETGDEKTPPAN
jgi:hypothetical protein